MIEPHETEKQCTKCGQCKTLSCFSPSKRGRDGLQSWCKSCRSAYVNGARQVTRRNKTARGEVWPRPLNEALMDLKSNKWRYPVEPGALRGRV